MRSASSVGEASIAERGTREHALSPVSVVLASCLAVFAAFFSIDLNRYGLDGDESVSRWLSAMPLAAMFGHIRTKDGVFALYYSVLHFWALGGHETPYLRASSVIFAAAGLAVVYFIAAMLFGRAVAAWAVCVQCVSFLFVKYATIARPYAMEFFLCAMAALFAVYAMQKKNDGRGPWLFAFCSILAVFAHPAAIAWIAALAISISAFDADRRAAALRLNLPLAAIVFFGVVPLAIVTAMDRFGEQIAWIGPITVPKFGVSLLYFSGGGSIIAAVLLGVLLAAAWRRVAPARINSLYLVLFWLMCSLALILLISVKTDITQPYYYIYCWIAVSILAGAGLDAIQRSRYAGAAIVLLALFAVLNLYEVADSPWRREDFRAAAGALHGKIQPSDAIVVQAAFYMRALYYAMEERGDRRYVAQMAYPRDGLRAFREDPPATLAENIGRRYASVWLILSHPDLERWRVVTDLIRRYPDRRTLAFQGVTVERLWRPSPGNRRVPR